MPKSTKNRVTSSKTTRGSQCSIGQSEPVSIVPPTSQESSRQDPRATDYKIAVEDVHRVLNLGRIRLAPHPRVRKSAKSSTEHVRFPLALATPVDSIQKRAIVTVNKLHIRTPPEGAVNTNRGLTLHAGINSMAGWARSYQRIFQSSIAAIAIDGFCFTARECEIW